MKRPCISLEHIAFYRTEIDVFFTVNTGKNDKQTERITLKREQFPNITNSLFGPIAKTAFAVLCEQHQEVHQALQAQAAFVDDIPWTYDLPDLSSD